MAGQLRSGSLVNFTGICKSYVILADDLRAFIEKRRAG
jgi:hypothetical protein